MAEYKSGFTGAQIDEGIEKAYLALPKSGGTMTGPLVLQSAEPTANYHAAPKKYVDDKVAEVQGTAGKNGVTFTPSVSADGDLSWNNDGGLANPATVNIKGSNGYSPSVSLTKMSDGKGYALKVTNSWGAVTEPIYHGETPVRGTDYWTDEDKAEIKAYVDEAILGGEW